MKFKLGDFVRFIDEKREGFITKIFDHQLVGVTGDDDFEIPTTVNNLTKVYGHHSNEEESKENSNTTTAVNFVQQGITLSISPDQNKSSIVHFYLINESSYTLLFCLNTFIDNFFKGEIAEIINPKSYLKIYSASLTDLNSWPKFIIRIVKYTPINLSPPDHIYHEFKFKGRDFALSIQKNALLNKSGWLFKLDEELLNVDIKKLKDSFYNREEKVINIEKPNKEIDLHIEKIKPITESFNHPEEILNFQIKYFKEKLEAAITHKYKSIVFIHGLGNGKLKQKIYLILKEYAQVNHAQNADYKKYGNGATEIFIK